MNRYNWSTDNASEVFQHSHALKMHCVGANLG